MQVWGYAENGKYVLITGIAEPDRQQISPLNVSLNLFAKTLSQFAAWSFQENAIVPWKFL